MEIIILALIVLNILTIMKYKTDINDLKRLCNMLEEDQEDFTKEEIEKLEEDYKNKIDNYNSSTYFNYVFDNNEVISINKKGVNNE